MSDAICAYYEQSWPDYRWLWFDSGSCALHFGYWDDETAGHADSLIRTNRVMASHARFRPGDDVLDVGCGIGGTAMWLAKSYPVGVTGITISLDQLGKARRIIRNRGLVERVHVECRDMTRSGFADASFDVAYAIESAGYATSTSDFLREMFRLLRPGGRLVVLDGFRARRSLADHDERLLGSWLADWALADLATIDEAAETARSIGFTSVEARDISANMRRSLRRLYRMATLLGPFELALWALRIRSTVQHRNLLGAQKQWSAFDRGLWRYYVLSAEKPAS